MTAGCISIIFDISNYIYIPREIVNLANQNLYSKMIFLRDFDIIYIRIDFSIYGR